MGMFPDVLTRRRTDLGYVLNHAMFQRNHRAGYVLKPLPLRNADKVLLAQRTKHYLDIKVRSASMRLRGRRG